MKLKNISFNEFMESDFTSNKYVSNDETEAWFDVNLYKGSIHCTKCVYGDEIEYQLGLWFDGKNYDTLHFHRARFVARSSDFGKAFRKLYKMYEMYKDDDYLIDCGGAITQFTNTSGSHWKKYSWS